MTSNRQSRSGKTPARARLRPHFFTGSQRSARPGDQLGCDQQSQENTAILICKGIAVLLDESRGFGFFKIRPF